MRLTHPGSDGEEARCVQRTLDYWFCAETIPSRMAALVAAEETDLRRRDGTAPAGVFTVCIGAENFPGGQSLGLRINYPWQSYGSTVAQAVKPHPFSRCLNLNPESYLYGYNATSEGTAHCLFMQSCLKSCPHVTHTLRQNFHRFGWVGVSLSEPPELLPQNPREKKTEKATKTQKAT